jgi:hypothetical protein
MDCGGPMHPDLISRLLEEVADGARPVWARFGNWERPRRTEEGADKPFPPVEFITKPAERRPCGR